MAYKLLSLPKPDQYPPGKPVLPNLEANTELVDLVGENSHFLFHVLKLDTNWLGQNVPEWELDEDFVKAKDFVSSVKVVNDPAERGIKLCQDFLHLLSKNSKTEHDIQQIVDHHRAKVSGQSKSELFQNL